MMPGAFSYDGRRVGEVPDESLLSEGHLANPKMYEVAPQQAHRGL